MKLLKRKCLGVLAFIVLPALILGCSSGKKEQTPNVAEEIKLNSGAVLKNEEGNYTLYDYESGKYEKAANNICVLAYDKNSSSYIYAKDGKDYAVHNGGKFEIKDSSSSKIKLSKDGKYISYFIEDNGLKLKVLDLNENKYLDMNSNVSISGTLCDWYDADTLVYYGVSNDNVNGIFTYNLKEGKEELLYKIKEGYLAFLKGTDDKLIFEQLTLENNKKLMMLDKKTKDIKLLADNIDKLSDVSTSSEKIYFTGKTLDNINSLYELKNDKAKRLVFDFPAIIKIDKGLTVDEEGNVLFIGVNNSESNKEQVYMYGKDNSISVVSKDSTDYAFVEYKS